MRLLIDANIVMDVLQKREPYYVDSAKIWKLCETDLAEGFITTLTFANLMYIMRKELSPDTSEDVLKKLSLIFRFADFKENDIKDAVESKWDDFEDSVQAVIAFLPFSGDLVYNSTSNVQKFKVSIGGESELKVITFLWLLFMLFLSHIGGQASGEESRWLSQITGVNEGLLRLSAHVVVYAVLATLAMLAWPEAKLWILCMVLVGIAVIDETSKALPIFIGRHCSVAETGLNCIGIAAGLILGQLITAMR